jgi:D-serine deaminase-like pyridoxal phosphate-dependent protein
MDQNRLAASLKILENAAQALRKNGFETDVFADGSTAAAHILELIGSGKTVGMGGTMSVADLGLAERLTAAKNEIVTHLPGMGPEERRRTFQRAQAADFYIASPQAVTRDGKMIFVDGVGNRVSAIAYGPGRVILLAGRNKLVRDTDEGLRRMRDVSALANNIRLDKANPCVKAGRCVDCSSPERICNVVTMFWKKPQSAEYSVVLVNEELGY